uniref:Uncharacterized protein n=2 Tax=Macaca TaxID=9539 RepID=A0A5F7ZMN8_MACMU
IVFIATYSTILLISSALSKLLSIPIPSSVFFSFVFLFLETRSHSVAQARVQWYFHTLLQPQTSELKQSSCFSLLSSWDYRRVTPHLASFLHFFVKTASRYVAQVGLELASSDSPALASQFAGITVVILGPSIFSL